MAGALKVMRVQTFRIKAALLVIAALAALMVGFAQWWSGATDSSAPGSPGGITYLEP